jgi:hypothetical protein
MLEKWSLSVLNFAVISCILLAQPQADDKCVTIRVDAMGPGVG